MPPGLRMTQQTQGVLRVLVEAHLQEAGNEVYGLQICDRLELGPGTVYPILARLLTQGWIIARDEEVSKREVGRATRRYYRLTDDGAVAARAALAEVAARVRRRASLAWPGRPAWER